ncbi:hypothetical protein Pan54_38830 [Rubinisphaera italica]|uniref:Uncharacterized protein n=1 Tax=Rubinisphaera italica TaxID=2527969 RepID=A0A5C5XL16_9PLAN|nr:hypothetical protein Pan54_38830 [Rubinisphaera italica]
MGSEQRVPFSQMRFLDDFIEDTRWSSRNSCQEHTVLPQISCSSGKFYKLLVGLSDFQILSTRLSELRYTTGLTDSNLFDFCYFPACMWHLVA